MLLPRNTPTEAEVLDICRLYKDGALNYKRRRLAEWDETYYMYRGKALLNRITQKQSVIFPLMKTSVKTLISNIDEPPLLTFRELDNDEQKEIYFNNAYRYYSKENKDRLKDIVDKNQAVLFGRTFKKQNIVNGRHTSEVIDPRDVLIDRYVDPASIDTARYLCHEHIYKPLSSLKFQTNYNQKSVAELEEMYAKNGPGLIKLNDNKEALEARNNRMTVMGVLDQVIPVLGETYVEINEHLVYLWDSVKQDEVLYLVVTADGNKVLNMTPYYQIIGETSDDYWCNHLSWTTWGDDTERTDFWSDGPGDIIRPVNRVLNAWLSQLIENRTLKNFNMHYYDATSNADGDPFVPQTFQPQSWGWYPMPGDPNKIVKDVMVSDLADSLAEIQFLIETSEKSIASNATQQGGVSDKKVTLGEVQLALAGAQERTKSMAVFYNDANEEYGTKFVKMLEAASDLLDDVTLSQKGRHSNKIYTKNVSPQDWISKAGFKVEVKTADDRQQEDIDQINKLNALKTILPNNKAFDTIYKEKALKFGGLTPEETREVLDEEKSNSLLTPTDPNALPQPNADGAASPTIVNNPGMVSAPPINNAPAVA